MGATPRASCRKSNVDRTGTNRRGFARFSEHRAQYHAGPSQKHGNKLTLEFTQEWGEKKRLKFEAFSMSDGTLRALGLLTALYQSFGAVSYRHRGTRGDDPPGALGAVLDILLRG